MSELLKHMLAGTVGFVTTLLANYVLSDELDYVGAFSAAAVVTILLYFTMRAERNRKAKQEQDHSGSAK